MKKKLLISWFPFPPIPNCKGFLNLTHTQIYRTFWDLYLLQGHYKISTLPTISRGPIHEKVEDMHTIIRYTCDTRATCKIENWVKNGWNEDDMCLYAIFRVPFWYWHVIFLTFIRTENIHMANTFFDSIFRLRILDWLTCKYI